MTELPSASENTPVQEALSIRYVDKIGLAWLPACQQWALFSNSGKLTAIVPMLVPADLQVLCEEQNKSWRAARQAEAEEAKGGPVVTSVSLGDLDL